MTTKKNRSLEKTVRLIILMEMKDRNELEGLSHQEISNILGGRLTKSTISRNLADAERLRKQLIRARNKIRAQAPE